MRHGRYFILTTEYILDRAMEQVLGVLTPPNRLVMRVMLRTGLRVGDVLALKTEKIGRQFWITEQKTGKRRRVNLPADLLEDLRRQAGKTWVFPHRVDPDRPPSRVVRCQTGRHRLPFDAECGHAQRP